MLCPHSTRHCLLAAFSVDPKAKCLRTSLEVLEMPCRSCTKLGLLSFWLIRQDRFGWKLWAFGIFNGLVFASAGPIIDIKLVTGINWTTFQHTRPNQWAKHWQRSLDTANLLDSVSIVKPCCTSRKAETINSPLSAKDTWLLLASSHRALFGS